MGVNTLRNRNAQGIITQLDLTDANAANRRFDLDPAKIGTRSFRFFGFDWTKTLGVAVDVTVQKIDKTNGSVVRTLGKLTGDTGPDGGFRPQAEETAGNDVSKPDKASDLGTLIRLQFSQAGAPCVCDPSGDWKEI